MRISIIRTEKHAYVTTQKYTATNASPASRNNVSNQSSIFVTPTMLSFSYPSKMSLLLYFCCKFSRQETTLSIVLFGSITCHEISHIKQENRIYSGGNSD